jgi:hypothetical protein
VKSSKYHFQSLVRYSGVWDILNFSLPNLSRAFLFGLKHLSEERRDQIFSTTPNFSKVKCLRATELFNWDLISFFPSSLEELFVHSYCEQNIPLELSRFKQLRILLLYREFWDRTDPVTVITYLDLPFLEELSLSGRFKQLGWISFKLPVLNRLTLKWDRKDVMETGLPVMQPSQLYWKPVVIQTEQSTRKLARLALGRILQHFTGSETLFLPAVEGTFYLKFCENFQGRRPPAWRIISFHNEDDEIVETIDIHDLFCDS